ncbi:MAG: hypothetical protein KIT35_26795 [Piscinibacter sp.]|uniref:acyl-CoA dehydrogenase family protein n=1 Tax=Piscinibacter TaxID=1114981 RepID=UPI000FDD56A0|nr:MULTISPECIES: acyl-CoA dehydrogenase family protein [Piscinibacter]MCW5667459.1 hypothetical protein [Piscinibacter sp.]
MTRPIASPAADDTDLVDFGVPEDLQPYLDAAADVARAPAARRAEAVRTLGLAEVLPELAPAAACSLLFHAARVLAQADPAAAWAGLHAAPAVWLAGPHGAPVALPAVPAGGWCAWLARPEEGAGVLLLDPAARRWRRGTAAPDWDGGAPLTGLGGARLVRLPEPDGDTAWQAAGDAAWQAHADAQLALHGGLIAGTGARLLDEAFEYAALRPSAGKPLLQHQAVALRLADATMAQASLGLYLQALACGGTAGQAPAAGYVAEVACGIARDALQTAAGHGYVDGLPFLRLFEAMQALCARFGALALPLCAPVTEEA